MFVSILTCLFPLFYLLSDCPNPKCRWSNPQAHQQRHGRTSCQSSMGLCSSASLHAHFPAVCRQWRSSMRQCHLPPMSPMPWSVLPGGNIVRFSHDQTSRFPDATRYHNSCGEWLLLSRDDRQLLHVEPLDQCHCAAMVSM